MSSLTSDETIGQMLKLVCKGLKPYSNFMTNVINVLLLNEEPSILIKKLEDVALTFHAESNSTSVSDDLSNLIMSSKLGAAGVLELYNGSLIETTEIKIKVNTILEELRSDAPDEVKLKNIRKLLL
jgi:hypothetical protein